MNIPTIPGVDKVPVIKSLPPWAQLLIAAVIAWLVYKRLSK